MRYARLEPLDMDHDALQETDVTVIGAGATGSHMIAQIARLGADIHVIDRDVLQEENLATSALYTTRMVDDRLPKAEAARKAAQRINPDITVEAAVTDVTGATIADHVDDPDIILDGTDNLETRHVINEYAAREKLPWVHVAAVRRSGTAMPVAPDGPCFSCLFADTDPAALPTCATAGIVPGAAATAASLGVQYAAALVEDDAPGAMTRFTLPGDLRTIRTETRDDCTVCSGTYPRLEDDSRGRVTALCGEDSYHVSPDLEHAIELVEIAENLPSSGEVVLNEHLLRYEGRDVFTLFPDGCAIVQAESSERARSIYARYVGN